MLSTVQDWAVIAGLVLLSDVLVWHAASFAGRRKALKVFQARLECAASRETGDDDQGREEIRLRLERVDKRLESIETALKRSPDSTTPSQSENPSDGIWDFAARLAERGTGVDELMALCNLGRGEAELIRALNSRTVANE